MYQLCTDTICSKPFYYGFLWLLMSFFLSYGGEQLVGIQQGIHKKKSELSQSTAGNLLLQPPDPIYVSKRGWQNQLLFFSNDVIFFNKKNHSNLHLYFKWCFDGLFFILGLWINVQMYQPMFGYCGQPILFLYVLSMLSKTESLNLQHQLPFKIFYTRTFPKVIKVNKYGPFSHD